MTGFYPNGGAPSGSSDVVALSVSVPPPADTTPPTFAGPITLSLITTTGAHAAWPAAADNVAVAGYQLSVDAGAPSWLDLGNVLACDISGKASGADYTVRVRAYDSASPRNYSAVVTKTLHTNAVPVVVPGNTIPRMNITVLAIDQQGNPLSGADVTAKLDRVDVDHEFGYVMPEEKLIEADADGVAILQLWPNVRGTKGSLYQFKIVNPDTGQILRLTATVPENDCYLHEIASLDDM